MSTIHKKKFKNLDTKARFWRHNECERNFQKFGDFQNTTNCKKVIKINLKEFSFGRWLCWVLHLRNYFRLFILLIIQLYYYLLLSQSARLLWPYGIHFTVLRDLICNGLLKMIPRVSIWALVRVKAWAIWTFL